MVVMSDQWTPHEQPPEGCVHAYALWGEPQNQYVMVGGNIPGGVMAVATPDIHIPYDDGELGRPRCVAKDGTCKGTPVRGSNTCMRHNPDVQAEMNKRRAERGWSPSEPRRT